MPTETELKLRIAPDAAAALLRHPALKSLKRSRPRAAQVTSTYFDTADGTLAAAGVALRLRRDGRRWVQTVKGASASVAGGLERPPGVRMAGPGAAARSVAFRHDAVSPRARQGREARACAEIHDRHHAHHDSADVSRQHDGAVVHRHRRGAYRRRRSRAAPADARNRARARSRRSAPVVRARADPRPRRGAGLRACDQGRARIRLAATAPARAGARGRRRFAGQIFRGQGVRGDHAILPRADRGQLARRARLRRSGVDPPDAHRRSPPARMPFPCAPWHRHGAYRAAAGRIALARPRARARA